MAMVRITNGKSVTTVSQKSFENKFRRYGWRKVREWKIDIDMGMDVSEGIEEPDIDTIPVSDMNGDQLKQYAKKHDIDISKTKSAADARKTIQAVMRSKNM